MVSKQLAITELSDVLSGAEMNPAMVSRALCDPLPAKRRRQGVSLPLPIFISFLYFSPHSIERQLRRKEKRKRKETVWEFGK